MQLDPVNRQILLVGLFEVVELGAPGHIISEHVDLAKSLVYEGAAALTNGDHRRRRRGRRQCASHLLADACMLRTKLDNAKRTSIM